jgi:two-component system OmpR family sensor kinase
MTTVDEVFLSRVGHDLRGELATMVAGVHYLLRYEADLSPTARQMLDRVNGAGQRLKRLLDEFDNAAWITGSDSRSLLCEPVAPAVVVQAALVRLSALALAREVRIDAHLPAELPEIEADPELLGTAFEYVIDFALARSPRRAIHLGAAIVGGVPVIEIRDEGGPIEAGLLDRLLEPFVEKDVIPRAEPGQRRRERLGLGLSIAQGILQAHGGGLRASLAASGDGVVFQCTPTRPSGLPGVPPVSGRRLI